MAQQFRGELGMKFHLIAKAALALSFLMAPCVAQTPRAAQDHFNRGESLYQKGDFEGAIADFTKAIEISSRLDNRDWKGDAGFAGARSNFDKVRSARPAGSGGLRKSRAGALSTPRLRGRDRRLRSRPRDQSASLHGLQQSRHRALHHEGLRPRSCRSRPRDRDQSARRRYLQQPRERVYG